MSTMTATRRPVNRKPVRPAHGTCRLVLVINGVHYTLRRIPTDPSAALRAWRLRRRPTGRTTTSAMTEHGPVCDCPDFVFHRDGLDPAGLQARQGAGRHRVDGLTDHEMTLALLPESIRLPSLDTPHRGPTMKTALQVRTVPTTELRSLDSRLSSEIGTLDAKDVQARRLIHERRRVRAELYRRFQTATQTK